MTITRFNWLELQEASIKLAGGYPTRRKKNVCKHIVTLMGLITGALEDKNKYTMRQFYAALHLRSSRDKPNFLLNAKEMLNYPVASVEDKCLVIFLAGKRNFADYKLNGTTSIPLELVKKDLEFYDWEKNPFLEVEEDYINFKLKK